jgi:hypothetical protein
MCFDSDKRDLCYQKHPQAYLQMEGNLLIKVLEIRNIAFVS